jgi:hypothetical protein
MSSRTMRSTQRTRGPKRAWAVLALACLGAAPLAAQERGEPQFGPLSSEISERAITAWNDSTRVRIRGRYAVEAGDTVRRSLVVLDGPLIVSGLVLGDVITINANVRLDSTAQVRGALLVVGGVLSGRQRGQVDGDLQVWRSALAYREEDGRFVADDEETLASRYARWRARSSADWSDVFVSSGHTYNRVEGLSIVGGPRLQLNRGTSRVTFEALGIFRTGDRLAWERENLGHRLLAEFRRGTDEAYVAVGARHIDEVDAVERWALGDAETGLTSLLVARDYRDYWNRFGGHGYLRVGARNHTTLTASVGREQWDSRAARNPWAAFRSGREWRVNPGALEGTATLVGLSASVDTRNDPERPLDGWWVRGDYERGHVDVTRAADPSQLALLAPTLTYGRLFVDARRYMRIAPHTSVNLRLVAGGLLHGDGLPAQRQLSVSGVDALPGYGFRAPLGVPDVGTCNTRPDEEYTALGRPVGCDRIVLLQAEWAGDFRVGLFGRAQRTDDRRWYTDGLRADGRWVVFVNSGRGWRVGEQDEGLTYPSGRLPLFEGFRSDVGVGLDLGVLGVYVAHPLNGANRTPRAFVRLGRRF